MYIFLTLLYLSEANISRLIVGGIKLHMLGKKSSSLFNYYKRMT